EQTFRNHTDRRLEANYVFPLPKGVDVTELTTWVDGKEQPGELLGPAKATEVYAGVVRRTRDPGLLEYVGNGLIRLKNVPVSPGADQKVKVRFTALAPQENGVLEYVYPLKTEGRAAKTPEEFSLRATIKSRQPIQNIYSPTHALDVTRNGDKEVSVSF